MNTIDSLTALGLPLMLKPLSQKTKVGISTPCKGEQSPLPLAVFLRPKFTFNTGLLPVLPSMVDCFRGILCPARSFAGSANLIQSTAQCLAPNGGGY